MISTIWFLFYALIGSFPCLFFSEAKYIANAILINLSINSYIVWFSTFLDKILIIISDDIL
jgi:hypothetical protein